MMEILQSEIVDQRKGQILKLLESDERKRQGVKSLESAVVGNTGILYLGSGFSTCSVPPNFHIPPGSLNEPQLILTNYDDILERAFDRRRVTLNLGHPLIVARPAASATRLRNRELQWRRTHREELEAFRNEWVALEGEEIIAHDPDPVRVFEDARQRGISSPYIFYVEPSDENVIRIGL